MRPTLFLSLLALCWLAAVAQGGNFWKARSARPVPDPALEEKVLSEQVEGTWKKTPQEAKEDALENARTRVIAYLRRQNPSVDWTPPADYVQTALVKEEKVERKEFEADVGTMYRVRLGLEVAGKDRAEMMRRARHYLMEQRQACLLKVLGAMVALLAVAAGYVRLDDWSKGYYTGWLRLGAVSCAALVMGTGVWLLLTCG
jgi:hypothetical protein